MRPFPLFFLFSTALSLPILGTAAVPEALQSSLQAARATGDAYVMEAVTQRAVAEYPEAEADIRAWFSDAEDAAPPASEPDAAPILLQEEVAPSPWSGSAELGMRFEEGNSKEEDIHAALNVTYARDPWSNTLALKADTRSEDGHRIEEKYRAENKTRYHLSERAYIFAGLGMFKDCATGYEYCFDERLGYGYHFYDTDIFKLSGEAGLGARQSKRKTGDRKNELIQRLDGFMDWQWMEDKYLSEHLRVEIGTEVTIIESETALRVRMAESLYLKLGFALEYASDVPAGKKNTDTEMFLNLVYDFGD